MAHGPNRPLPLFFGFPDGSAGKESACSAGDLGSVPRFGGSTGEGKGYPLQYSGLENSMDCIVHRIAKNRTWLSDFHFTSCFVNKDLLKHGHVCVCACVHTHLVMSNALRPHWTVAHQLLCPWDFPGKNTGVGCHFLLQGIFQTHRSNLCLLHCRWILYFEVAVTS